MRILKNMITNVLSWWNPCLGNIKVKPLPRFWDIQFNYLLTLMVWHQLA